MNPQKYVIYINDNPLFLVNRSERLLFNEKKSEKDLVFPYQGRKKAILNFVDFLEKNQKPASVALYTEDVKQLWKDFKQFYKIIEAAGGYVENDKGQVLAIFRIGAWDLPKGKIDPGETKKEAAVREVEEETGLKDVGLGEKLCKSYHTYRHKGKRVLKKTYWYKMQSNQVALTPQTEEGIEHLEWMQAADLLKKETLYDSLKPVIHLGMGEQ